jgi:hypothetical protein
VKWDDVTPHSREPTVSLTAAITPAHRQAIDSLSRRVFAAVASPDKTANELEYPLELILHSTHAELAPAAAEMLRGLQPREGARAVVYWLLDTLPQDQANAILLQYLLSRAPENFAAIFRIWKDRNVTLGTPELARLATSDNLRLKLLLLAEYGDRLDEKWRQDVVAQVKRLYVLPTTGEVADSLVELGAAEFAKREAATARLARYGAYVEPALRDHLNTTNSAEARSRIQALLERAAEPLKRDVDDEFVFLFLSPQTDAKKLVRIFLDPSTPESAITARMREIARLTK